MNVLDLFSGIGGFSLGLERAGMKTVAFCEIEKYPQRILRKHWPDVPIFDDIRKLHATDLSETIDVICGGFPCQDISVAGLGNGLKGERSGLWNEYKRLIGEIMPKYVIVENSPALLVRGFGTILKDLSTIGYDAEWSIVSAEAIGAPHKRERLYIVAYSNSLMGLSRNKDIKHGAGKIFPFSLRTVKTNWTEISSSIGRMANGIPGGLDYNERVKALGNSVVPQIVELIGRAIMEIEKGAIND